MRITTGIAGGREIFVPKSELRPTQDKVRQALFSSLGAAVVGCRFLDLFAGSGAVGLEAWSRGADFVCCVEKDFRGVEAIARNVGVLKVPAGAVQVLKMDVGRFLERPVIAQPFDFVFADPPYAGSDAQRGREKLKGRGRERVAWAETVLNGVAVKSILKRDGLVILEQGEDEPVCEAAGWGMVQERRYSAAKLVVYRMIEG